MLTKNPAKETITEPKLRDKVSSTVLLEDLKQTKTDIASGSEVSGEGSEEGVA